jgi:hypothetical protein
MIDRQFRIDGVSMKTACPQFIVLFIVTLFVSPPAVCAKQPDSTPEPEYIFYLPFVAKQWWGTESGWLLTVLSTNDGINYYAELASGGWTVEGKNVQAPNWAYLVPVV